MMGNSTPKQLLTRLLACLAGSLVLALMVGNQEGTQEDYGLAFHEAILSARVFVFLALGVLAFFIITFQPVIQPYVRRPGIFPFVAGVLTVVAAIALLHWNDLIGDAKFASILPGLPNQDDLAPLASAFFKWLAWILLAVVAVLTMVAIALRVRLAGYAATVLALVAVVIAWTSHSAVVDLFAQTNPSGADHSLGAGVYTIGYVLLIFAAMSAALSKEQTARTRLVYDNVVGWRPGLPLVAIGTIVALISFGFATWLGPQSLNDTMIDTKSDLDPKGLAPFAVQYLGWLAWVLLVISAGIGAFAAYRRISALGWVGAILGAVSTILTLVVMYDVSSLGADLNIDSATGPWQGLGTGGWLAAGGFFLIGAGGFMAATAGRTEGAVKRLALPVTEALTAFRTRSSVRTFALFAIAFALFFPPTMNQFWQKALVTDIGVYVLLAIGLNVVVGWAGLLDLGFIAFYAIGSYTTAYLVGSLPVKPPSFLHLSPLLAIPFAIIICLLAGVLLGAPTLRLRGDYLAIVTLGFGEIIRIMAINLGGVTNSTRGPDPAVPHPVINLGFWRVQFGLNQLQYWYLLLVLIAIIVVLFWRIEGSRIGRAWAAIREDEVAAQATGINATKFKLMAFAIGASTSGVAGVFFASQVGYFNPDNFVLNNSILVVAYVVFGGMGSLPGAIAGAAVLTWLPDFLRDQVPADDRQMWIGAILLLMMIFRPAGLLPARRRKAELSGFDAPDSAETRAVPVSEGL